MLVCTGRDTKVIIDTFTLDVNLRDTLWYVRNMINAEFYNEKYEYKTNDRYIGIRGDSIWTRYKTGELFTIVTARGFGQIYGESIVYWKNGNKKFKWNFKDGLKEGSGYQFREKEGTLECEYSFEKGIRKGKKCYDTSGKKEVICDKDNQ